MLRRPMCLMIAGLLTLAAGCEKRVPVVHRVDSQRELNTILVFFDRLGIRPVEVVVHASRREKSWEIRVPQPLVEQARRLLMALDLPRSSMSDEAESSSLIPSPEELAQQARQRVQRRLEEALEMYDGVVRARVLIAPAQRDELTQRITQPPSASVVVRYAVEARAGADANPPVMPEQVQQIVAGAVPALTPDDVQVSYARVMLPQPVERSITTQVGDPLPAGDIGQWKQWLHEYGRLVAGVLIGAGGVILIIMIIKRWLWPWFRRPRAAIVAEG